MIAYLFYGLFFLVPLILFPYSSELFEFNKMILVYIATVLIGAAWLSRCVAAKKILFRRTTLDIPILLFLAAMALSTFHSIDIRTSLLGYYSRFHGGLLSYLCYCLLYWAYVSNCKIRDTRYSILALLSSALLVSVYGILQHFGIDKNVWVQDVQNRIFSTLGQPNWLAAWIVALTPITWGLGLKSRYKILDTRYWFWTGLSSLFFIVLLFTKSRSGLLGLGVAYLVFWSLLFIQGKFNHAKNVFLLLTSSFLLLSFLIGTPFTNKIIPAPETGGTESGEIRKIVWQGATDLWKKYPILGTGPETFAYSYYETRPVAHNLVSEWDFLYNKAHNEYLNFAATTGSLGLISYLLLIGSTLLLFIKSGKVSVALMAGYVSILVTNFFGFSVVPVAILFFMFPAFASTLAVRSTEYKVQSINKLRSKQKIVLLFVLCTMLYVLFAIGKYWYADLLYAKGNLNNDATDYQTARTYLVKAVNLSPSEATYWSELSRATTGLAESSPDLARVAVLEGQKAISLSPRNLNLQRNMAAVFLKLAATDPSYLQNAKVITQNSTVWAPTDAKLYYNLALTNYRLGLTEEALKILGRTIEMKPNYKNARFAKALILIEQGRRKEAKEELGYILEKIDPNDNLAREELEKL